MATTINASTSAGLVSTADTSGVLQLQAANTTVLNAELGKALALQGASSTTGCGIAFPATQVASSDANTLDDYEEGTWTPVIGGTATYTTQTGIYTKIGNTVVLWGELTINVIGTGSTTRISGIPFTSNGSSPQPGSSGYFASLAQSVYSISPGVEPGTTNVKFDTQTSLSGTNNINAAVFGNSARIQFCVTYRV